MRLSLAKLMSPMKSLSLGYAKQAPNDMIKNTIEDTISNETDLQYICIISDCCLRYHGLDEPQ